MSVILSSVISPTGGMVMCFLSNQVSILPLQKDVLFFPCFLLLLLWQNPQLFLPYILLLFSTCCFLVFESFHKKKTSVTGQQLALWLLTDLLFSLLEDLTSLPSDGFFCFNSAVIHKVAQCAIPMHIFHPPYQDWTTAHV